MLGFKHGETDKQNVDLAMIYLLSFLLADAFMSHLETKVIKSALAKIKSQFGAKDMSIIS